MNLSQLVSVVQVVGSCVIVWRTLSWHTLGPLVTNDDCLKHCCCPYQSLCNNGVSSSDILLKAAKTPCHKITQYPIYKRDCFRQTY